MSQTGYSKNLVRAEVTALLFLFPLHEELYAHPDLDQAFRIRYLELAEESDGDVDRMNLRALEELDKLFPQEFAFKFFEYVFDRINETVRAHQPLNNYRAVKAFEEMQRQRAREVIQAKLQVLPSYYT